jgi:hypothetical protein
LVGIIEFKKQSRKYIVPRRPLSYELMIAKSLPSN